MPPEPAGVSIPDLDLIRQAALSDGSSLQELYDRHAGVVYSMALKLARDSGIAEDATQDTFCQAWREAARFDPERGSVRGWLLMMVRARTLDRLRARGRRSAVVTTLDEHAAASAEDAGPWPDAQASGREQLSAVRNVLELLPGRDRRLIELAFFEGLTHAEIAAHVDEPLGTVKTHIRRALQILRVALAGESQTPFTWTDPVGLESRRTFEEEVLRARRVLIVNSDARSSSLLSLVLLQAGARIDVASSPAAAARRCSAQWPDVLLADLDQPAGGGYAVLAHARELSRRLKRALPVVALAGTRADTRGTPASEHGCELVLTKPLRPAALVAGIARVLSIWPYATRPA